MSSAIDEHQPQGNLFKVKNDFMQVPAQIVFLPVGEFENEVDDIFHVITNHGRGELRIAEAVSHAN